MSGPIIALLWIAGIVGTLWLVLVPALILRELKRQGKARAAEAQQIIARLSQVPRAQNSEQRICEEEARLQALADAHFLKTKSGPTA